MQKTDAPRVVWYCNSALGHETRMLSLPRPRHPHRILRLWRDRRPIHERIATAAAEKVDVIPNSEHTRRVRCPRPSAAPSPGRRWSTPRSTCGGSPPCAARQGSAATATVARFAPEKNLGGAVG